MAIKKSELYSRIWASCDVLRGGMDASQYKDYVLVLLFIKYISDKYTGSPYDPIKIPEGARFKDMVALKGNKDIGNLINSKVFGALITTNPTRFNRSDFPDFNDPIKLGDGNELVDRLTKLIAIFEDKSLDFSKNRAAGDDILGDAYEYLMQHFAVESGKSKGQFYTPAEVSRVIAQIIGIKYANTTQSTTVYDPTCGSGSLLLKVADEAGGNVSLYGQEKDATTSGLARMNMVIHGNPFAEIRQGNTITDPKLDENGLLKTYDFVVANPPFSDKRWSIGLEAGCDFDRFSRFGMPPHKQGDYAYLLHIVRSLNDKGKGACILPHGVLFRGNAEGEIRRNLINSGYIKGIIGLPANLFYGTGIPACIIVLDKENAADRPGIFLVDASQECKKDGNKNRLREMNIHKIVDTFNKQTNIPKYSRFVLYDEIKQNDFNLNIPRYIDNRPVEDIQDIDGHLRGGIPERDINALQDYWEVCPQLRKSIFKEIRTAYLDLAIEKSGIKSAIHEHPEFAQFTINLNALFSEWRTRQSILLKEIKVEDKPKQIVVNVSEDLLFHYSDKPLIDKYCVFERLMKYWAETMQDDCYFIVSEGWKIQTVFKIDKDKKGIVKSTFLECDLIPKPLLITRYFYIEQEAINNLKFDIENVKTQISDMEDEHGGDEGILNSISNKKEAQTAWIEAMIEYWSTTDIFGYDLYRKAESDANIALHQIIALESDYRIDNLRNEKGNITKPSIKARIEQNIDGEERAIIESYQAATKLLSDSKSGKKKLFDSAKSEIQQRIQNMTDDESLHELRILTEYIRLKNKIIEIEEDLKNKIIDLDIAAHQKYHSLTEDEIKILVVEDKWMNDLGSSIHNETDRISQALTTRVKDLSERYETPLPHLTTRVDELEQKVHAHLAQMGFTINNDLIRGAGNAQ